ncbi:hypothetical protein Q6U63_004349 [Vibrio fluvialis]|nr:hypothetical protein [Vibrio fluvialis]
MDIFKAGVQYNDLSGTAAADRADDIDATTWLRTNGYITKDEFVAGITLLIGENHGQHTDPVDVRFLVAEIKEYDKFSPLDVRVLHKKLPVIDFLAFFKRLNIAISTNGILDTKGYLVLEDKYLD